MNGGRRRRNSMVIGLAAGMAMAGMAVAFEEVQVTLDQVPGPVRDAILREAAGARITEIERETKNGQTFYEAEFLRDGREVEIKLSPDGAVIGSAVEDDDDHDPDLTLAQIPPAAATALQKAANGATIHEVESEREHGVMIYEAEWSAGGAKCEAAVTADGTLLEIEERVALQSTPAAVQSAIAQHFGEGAKVVVEKKTVIYYEAKAKIDGREKELYIFPTGRVHESSGDDDHDNDGDHDDDDDDDE